MPWSYFQMLVLSNNSAVRGLYENYVTIKAINSKIHRYVVLVLSPPNALIRDQVTKLNQSDRVPVGR